MQWIKHNKACDFSRVPISLENPGGVFCCCMASCSCFLSTPTEVEKSPVLLQPSEGAAQSSLIYPKFAILIRKMMVNRWIYRLFNNFQTKRVAVGAPLFGVLFNLKIPYHDLSVALSWFIIIFSINTTILSASPTITIRLSHMLIPIESMVLLYMVTWIPSTKTPFMLALIYQHHGSVMGYVPKWDCTPIWGWCSSIH